MTEEIIIDGVNVAGCDFFAKEDLYNSYSGEMQAYKGECGCSDDEMCKDIKNCCYKKQGKQLKRLEQENKELKAYIDVNEDFKKAWDELNEKHKRYHSALEEIREHVSLWKVGKTELYLDTILDKINEVLK